MQTKTENYSIFSRTEDAVIRKSLRQMVYERFRLGDDAIVMVTEIACVVSGCPPVETVFAFWMEDAVRRQFRIFKPARMIKMDDLPPWWMKTQLVAADWIDCSCC